MTSSNRRPTRTSRRTYLAALGTGFIAGTAGCNFGANPGVTSEALEASGGVAEGWGQHTKLTPTDDGVHGFGSSVALAGDGTTALVSATYHEATEGLRPGPAYVIEGTGGRWRMQAELTPDDGDSNMLIGWGEGSATALSDDATTALLGAERADEPNGPEAGSAYVFERTDGTWGEQFKLLPDDGDRKTSSASPSRSRVTARWPSWGPREPRAPAGKRGGQPTRSSGPKAAGASRPSSLPTEDGERGDVFGRSVALVGDTALIGTARGKAYVF